MTLVKCISEVSDIPAIRADWRELRLASATRQVALDPGYVEAAWKTIHAKNPELGLRIFICYSKDVVIGVLPLYIDARKMTLQHIGCGSLEEYAGGLWRLGAEMEAANAILKLAFKAARVIRLFGLAPDDPLALCLASSRIKHMGGVSSPVIALDGLYDAEKWKLAKSKSFRQSLRYNKKRIEQRGTIRSGIVRSGEDTDRFVDWFFAKKRNWLVARNIRTDWLLADGAPIFFKDLLREQNSDVQAYHLSCADAIVAGAILFNGAYLEFFMVTQDIDYETYSPGHLLLDGILSYACLVGKDIDLRITHDAYKMRWANRFVEKQNIHVATSIFGAPMIARKYLWGTEMKLRRGIGKVRRSLRLRRGRV